MNKFLIIILCVTGFQTTVQAQQYSISSDSLKWTFTAFDNLDNNEQVNQQGYFTTTPSHIVWVQTSGEKTYTFNVTASSGTWADVSQNGSITFTATLGSRTGTLTFARSGSAVTVSMLFIINGKNVLPYTYHVQTITPQ